MRKSRIIMRNWAVAYAENMYTYTYPDPGALCHEIFLSDLWLFSIRNCFLFWLRNHCMPLSKKTMHLRLRNQSACLHASYCHRICVVYFTSGTSACHYQRRWGKQGWWLPKAQTQQSCRSSLDNNISNKK